MYKKIFMGIAAVAALTLVSCSSEDLNSLSDNSSKNEAISFDGYLGRSAVSVNGSRGSELNKDALQKSTEGFGVFGNYSSEGTATAYGKNWFDNEQVTYKTSAWTYNPVKYWLPQGHIDFLAYAPYVGETTLKNNTSIDFTVKKDVADQKDLLWANAANKTKDNISSTNNKVKFQFAHALSRLGYTVKLNNDYSGATFTLTKITLAGSSDGKENAFYTTGTIDLSKTSSTGLWTTSSADAKQNFDWFSGTQTLATTDYKNPDANYLFVIPQDFSATATGKLYVIVEYTIKNYNGVTTPMTNKVYQKLEKNFLQGKAYTINLTLGLTPIEFDATVEGWTDINQGEINSWN